MKRTTKRSVPDTMSGFLYQFERAVYHLASCDSESVVGVETDDDVAVQSVGKPAILEQDKHSGQETGHPFQDSSPGLWNTLLIWLEAARDGEDRYRDAELHMVTNRPVPVKALAARIGKNDLGADEIEQCVSELRSIASEPSESMARLMGKVASFSDDELAAVIRRVRLSDASSHSDGPALRQLTVSGLHIRPDLDSDRICQALLGWMQDTLRETWRRGEPGWVSRAAFDRQLDLVVRHEGLIRRRERAESLVPVSDDQRQDAKSRAFVEQLKEIELEDEDILRSVDCYLRFIAERFRLANEGDITREEWEGFFSHLCERWKTIARRVTRNRQDETDEETGRAVYYETADGEHLAPLAGRPTEHYYFTSGGYHRLADTGEVWWHPGHGSTGGQQRKRGSD
jgi:hypothetical protein